MLEINLLGIKIGECSSNNNWANTGSVIYFNASNLADIFVEELPHCYEDLVLFIDKNQCILFLENSSCKNINLQIDFEKLLAHKNNIDFAE